MNWRTHTTRFVNLGAQLVCVCVCVCTPNEGSSILPFVFFERPQLVVAGDWIMTLLYQIKRPRFKKKKRPRFDGSEPEDGHGDNENQVYEVVRTWPSGCHPRETVAMEASGALGGSGRQWSGDLQNTALSICLWEELKEWVLWIPSQQEKERERERRTVSWALRNIKIFGQESPEKDWKSYKGSGYMLQSIAIGILM